MFVWWRCRTSLQYGIACLKRVNYDRIDLDRRREDSSDDVKGICLCTVVWLIELMFFHSTQDEVDLFSDTLSSQSLSCYRGILCGKQRCWCNPFPFLGGCWIKRWPGLRLIYRWPWRRCVYGMCRRDGLVQRASDSLGPISWSAWVLRQSDRVGRARCARCSGRVVWSSQHGTRAADSIVQRTGRCHDWSSTQLTVILSDAAVLSPSDAWLSRCTICF